MPKRRKQKQDASLKSIIIYALIGSAVGTAVFFILMAAVALFCLKKDTNPEAYKFFVLAVGIFAGIVCGYTAAKPTKKKGIVTGALSALPMFMVAICIGMLTSHSGVGLFGWLLGAVMLVGGAVGGITAVN